MFLLGVGQKTHLPILTLLVGERQAIKNCGKSLFLVVEVYKVIYCHICRNVAVTKFGYCCVLFNIPTATISYKNLETLWKILLPFQGCAVRKIDGRQAQCPKPVKFRVPSI